MTKKELELMELVDNVLEKEVVSNFKSLYKLMFFAQNEEDVNCERARGIVTHLSEEMVVEFVKGKGKYNLQGQDFSTVFNMVEDGLYLIF